MRGAAGQPIPCWGERTLDLSFHGRKFSWTFLLAAVSFPIIGVDFLRHHQLMVDPQQTHWWTGKVKSALRSHQHPHRRPPPQSPASSVTSLLSHRPLQSPSSSVTGLLSHRPPQSLASPLIVSGTAAASAAGAESYAQLLAEFPAVVKRSRRLPRKLSGDVEHHIVTKGPP